MPIAVVLLPLLFSLASPALLLNVSEKRNASEKDTMWERQISHEFSPDDFGAVGDGHHDDSKAVAAAFSACARSSSRCSVVFRGHGKIYLSGPQTIPAGVFMELSSGAELRALPRWLYPNRTSQAAFLVNEGTPAEHGTRLEIIASDGGAINMQGAAWWPCKKTGCFRPHMMAFTNITGGLVISGLKAMDSANHFLEVADCAQVRLSGLHLSAPNHSPNTDGVNFFGGHDQELRDSVIENGDDCVSVVNSGVGRDSSKANNPCVADPSLCTGGNVVVRNVLCRGGHGASIGSIRHGIVQNVTFRNMTLTGSPGQTLDSGGGARIKTYPNGTGSVSGVLFEDVVVAGPAFPVQILARYCPRSQKPWPCPEGHTAVSVHSITFRNIRGYGRSAVAGIFDCGTVVPCENISLENVDITAPGGVAAAFNCSHAHGSAQATVPPSCLLSR